MNDTPSDKKRNRPPLAFQPLYKQVEQQVIQFIVQHRWKPGEMLPNEFQLAAEFNVSQGTVRKALNSLTGANILVRRQGIGTFVAEHGDHHQACGFYPLLADGKRVGLAQAELLSMTTQAASESVARGLALKAKEKVVVLVTRCTLDNEFYCAETIYLPYKWFKGLLNEKALPHSLYHYYQTQFNMTVHSIRDCIKADIATANDAVTLNINQGEPLLEVTRIALSLNDKPMEYRVSRCRSDKYHYLVESH